MGPSPEALRFWSPATLSRRPAVAISSCLAGNAVRYDGGNKKMALLERLRAGLELFPFCPETAAALGVPRPPVRLVADHAGYRAIGRDQPTLDVTGPLLAAATDIARQLERAMVVAVIFKSRSPSCGLGSTPAYAGEGGQLAVTSGLAAAAITAALPGLLAVEESSLQTPGHCDRLVAACKLALEWRELDERLAPQWLEHYARQFEAPRRFSPGSADPGSRLLQQTLLSWIRQ